MPPELMQANRSGVLYPFAGAADAHARELLADCFIKQLGWLPAAGADAFAGVPVVLPFAQMEAFAQLADALRKALEQVVTHYFQDERIRAVYGLDPFLESVLALAEGRPYSIGACRPDFLQTPEGQPKICEIGARFPLNGWIVSYYLNRFSTQLAGYPAQAIAPVQALEHVPEVFLQHFDGDKPVALLMDHEKGSEIHGLLDVFRRQGRKVYIASPQTLELREGTLCAEGLPVDQFILEMDREELRKFQPEILQKLVQESTYINDVRTLILVHDKRVLAVLYDEHIMREYLPPETYDVLRPFLIPSFSLHNADLGHRITTDTGNWVLKESSGGRGVGMYVRHECDEQQWRQVVEQEGSRYMVQTYVPQQPYEWEGQTIHIVGMLLCFNEAFLGTGVYRGSHHSIVNVHQGRGILFPAAVSKAK